MRIAVNTRFLFDKDLEWYSSYLYETFSRITKKHAEHEFIFIFDRAYDQRFIFGQNVKTVLTGPPARHPLIWKWWYGIKIPAVLKKNNTDVFVSCDGLCSLRTKIPQCLVIHDLAFLHYPKGIKKSHLLFFKKYTPQFLEKAKSIVTVSEFYKQEIISRYGISADKIDTVYSGVKEIFQPVADETKELTRIKYTDGKEYFLYAGAIHPQKNLMNLLKAFSVFKKRQQTNMKLLLAGRLAPGYESFIENLKTYKYRKDVVLTGHVEEQELVRIIGSAYGVVYPSLFEGSGVPVLEAMKSDVPVITCSGSAMEEIAKNSALYADAASYTDMADKMMLLYKDENLRKDLIQTGRKIAEQFNWDKAADLLWESIQKASLR